MNDLAEKALHGLEIARREVCARPMLGFAALGLAFSSVILVFGSEVGAAQAARPLTTWFGLQDTRTARPGVILPGALLLGGIVALLLTWLVVVAFVRRTGQPERRVWGVAAAWAAPFAIGPPLMNTTAYSYVAFGLLQRHGHSPYTSVPSDLGDLPVVSAISAGGRATPSGVGPLGTLVQHLAVSVGAGNALAAVIILRLIALLAVIASGRLVAELARRQRAGAVSMVILNPLVLLYVVSALHLDGLLAIFVLASVLAATRQRWGPAVVYGCLAGLVSGQGYLVLPFVFAMHWFGRRETRPAWWRLIGQDIVLAAVTITAVSLAATDGFGWFAATRKQFAAHTPFSVAGATVKILNPIVRGASSDDLIAGARVAAFIAMACVLGYLLVSVLQRPLEQTVGFALLAAALLAPVLYAWYLLWGVLCLVPRADRPRRIAVLALCSAGCLLNPPGFSTVTTNVLTGIALALVAGATALVSVRPRHSQTPTPAEQPELADTSY